MRLVCCPSCGVNFETKAPRKTYCSHQCQLDFNRGKTYHRSKTDYKKRCYHLKVGAQKRSSLQGRPFDITTEDLIQLWDLQDGKCAISGLEFDLRSPGIKGEPRYNAPSLDRIVPTLGYVKDNIRLVTYQINMAMGPYGLERLLDTMDHIRKNIGGLA